MHSYLLLALEQAQLQQGFCAPNPAVGAVIVNEAGKLLAVGSHQGPGTAHAEVMALNALAVSAKNTTLYVTLEPCCHYGRTPPCTDAIIKAGIKKVVYGFRDPNPIVAGKGAAQLLAAGIACEYVALPEIAAFYRGYQHWHAHKTPFVTAKIAMTLNGKIAGTNGERVQITGAELQKVTHKHRKENDAILTSAKTIRADNPLLNVRLSDYAVAKPIYILDRTLDLSPSANILSSAKSITLLHAPICTQEKINFYQQLGVRCIAIESMNNHLNLQQVIAQIGQDGAHHLWVEAGGELTSALLQEQLIQRLLVYVAPRLLVSDKNAFTPQAATFLKSVAITWQQYGDDVLADIFL